MVKKKTQTKIADTQPPALDFDRELIILGHLIKYNLYLSTKSTIFAAILNQLGDVDKAVEETNRVIGELDLDSKRKVETQN